METRKWIRNFNFQNITIVNLSLGLILFSILSHASFDSTSNQTSSQTQKSKGVPGVFDYYVLSLSWSPEFCASEVGQKPEKQEQCSKPLGFVVHGLWPQYNSGGYPSDCGAADSVPDSIADIVTSGSLSMPPGDPSFIEHEWSKHGTCTGLRQLDYFEKIKTAAEKINIPKELKAPKQDIDADFEDIVSFFSSANLGLSEDMLGVSDDQDDNIKEVDICFNKQLEFQACNGIHKKEGGTFVPVKSNKN